MPTIRQLMRLFRSLSEKDLASAEQIAKQITLYEEKKGHFSAAQSLRAALHSNGTNGHRGAEAISVFLPMEISWRLLYREGTPQLG